MAVKKYSFTQTEITAGLMVIISLAVAVAFVVVIERLQPEPERKVLYARFTSTVGLGNNALVRFGGVEVGRVAAVTYDPDDQSRILVEARVDPRAPVNASSIATIEQVGLTSEKHLEISTGTPDAALLPDGGDMQVVNSGYGFIDIPDVDGLVGGSEQLIADVRDFLGVEAAKKAEAAGGDEMASIERIAADVRAFLGVKKAIEKAQAEGGEAINVALLAEDLRRLLGVEAAIETEASGGKEFASVSRITGDVRDLLGVEEAKAKAAGGGPDPANVENVIASVDSMLDGYDRQIETILDKVPPLQESATRALDGVARTVTDNKANIDGIIKNLNEITGTVSKDLETLLVTLEQTLAQVKDLTGETRDLVHFNRPAIEDLVGDLGNTIQSLNVLLEELKSHPQSVLFGRPESGRK
ncbi:MAG: MCE family protein [Candidatus Hydrogenedentes bacterium]|nr:MCE family protein [Candidatus Hydrogenedentota bacterium]